MRIYKIRTLLETVVASDDDEWVLRDLVRDEWFLKSIDDSLQEKTTQITRIYGAEDLPEGWNLDCTPYGDNAMAESCAEILSHVQRYWRKNTTT